MEFYMIEKFKCLLKDGQWPVSPHGILISLDDSEDSFDSAAEEDDEEYLNEIFYSHSVQAHKPNYNNHEGAQAHLRQIFVKEMNEKYAQQSAKNAAELLQEEEEEKLKEERRKERKRRKKERRKAEKESTKNCTSYDNGDHKNGNVPKYNEALKGNEKNKKDNSNSIPNSERSDEDDENEGFLDVNSAFVTKVVKHKLRNNLNNGRSKSNSSASPNKGTPTSPKQSPNGTRIVPIPEKNILLGERLAVAGYHCASKESYIQAIELFTRALRNVPNDHRYWGNRSFCYFQIGAYQKALEDADCAIQLAPNSPKGHYRRAEALAGLKNLVAAEKSFEKVLELDVDCKDALDELLNIRLLRITEMGFDRKLASCALKKYSSLEAAVEALMNNENFEVESDNEGNMIYQSDEEIDWENVGIPSEDYISDHQQSPLDPHQQTLNENVQYEENFIDHSPDFMESDINGDENRISKKQAAMDPSNPNRCVSIWVGNIEDCVAEKTLNEEFSRFGEILSIRMLPSSHCAFINFKDSKAPGPAMAAMQGKELAGKKLLVRYPNKTKEEQHMHQQMMCHQKRWQSALSESDSESAAGASGGFSYVSQPSASNTKTTLVPSAKGTRIKLKGPVNGDECYYWRTTGCAFGENCRNKHIKQNRGIDRKPWHK